ncbi:hypothetical protein JR065_19450 [Xanthomonas sp. AmX2]|uniref:hypothetical protein n=1 Tax=Xanthomonas sp. TaxID=29446 RepID=UPI0019819A8F|nr:hypothetical protein [Xanthomonas sp.]MBN6152513.1 hypothetical protein [Xanthomonas sp.]
MPRPIPRGAYWIAVAVLVVAAATVAAWRERPRDAASRQPLGEAIGDSLRAAAERDRASPAAPPAPAPRANRPDGGVHFDARGQVLPDAGLRRHFDGYLSAFGAQDPVRVRQRLGDDLAARMSAAQAQAVLDWFDRYAAYVHAASALPETADPLERQRRLQALRSRLLGAQAAAGLFVDETAGAAGASALRDLQAYRSEPIAAGAGVASAGRADADPCALDATRRPDALRMQPR